MVNDRFELRAAAPGFWSVIDRGTNQPASYRNCLMVRLRLDEADAFAELLNENWRLTPEPGGDGPPACSDRHA